MMKALVSMMLMLSLLVAAAPTQAAECNEDTAADLNSRIEANFTMMDDSNQQNAAAREKIEALKQKFSKASQLQSDALDSGDQAGLNEACGLYQSILKEQADLGE